MPCHHVKLPGGVTAIVCGSRRLSGKPCVGCGRPSTKLCDYPMRGVKAGQTCSRPVCDKCAVHQDPDVDFCPTHGRMLTAEGKLTL